MARKSKEKVTIGSYTLPGGLGGEMVRFACGYLAQHPEGVTAKELVGKSACAAGLNVSTAAWLTSPNQPNRNSPTGFLFDRRQEVNTKTGRKVFVYFLLPDGEKLAGTFGPVRKARIAEEKRKFRAAYGVSPGDQVRFIPQTWSSRQDVPAGTLAFVTAVDDTDDGYDRAQVLTSEQQLMWVSLRWQVRRVKTSR